MATTTTPSTHAGCGCGCGPGDAHCDDPQGLERTRYFAGQVLAPEDFTQDQHYFLDKHRRHNRHMHGWGVVCGAGVTQAAGADGAPVAFTVSVAPGYALGPFGDEILVDREVSFDVRRIADDAEGACPPPADPWCAPVRADRDPQRTIYLAIRHDECEARPVAVESGCACGSECEYSRIVDGFELSILDTLPKAYADDPYAKPQTEDRGKLFLETVSCSPALHASGRPCPACPTSPWIILADIKVARDGTLTIDQWAHRRLIAAFGAYGFYCTPAAPPPPPPPPPAQPPQLMTVWPPAKAMKTGGPTRDDAIAFFQRPRLELKVSRPIVDAAMTDCNGWLRAFIANRDGEFIYSFEQLTTRFDGATLDASNAATITIEFPDHQQVFKTGWPEVLVIMRPDAAPAGLQPLGADLPPDLLDANFAGSPLDPEAVKTIFDGGGIGPVKTLVGASSEGATLHDGAPGGLVHYGFSVAQEIG